MVEKLGDVPGAATCSEMFVAGGGVYGAVEQDMHNGLDRHAAWAGHLACMIYKGVPGDYPVQCAECKARELSCFLSGEERGIRPPVRRIGEGGPVCYGGA
jgi:hypothetical protein